MGQIIWLEPSGSIALTALGEAISAQDEAARLQELGHVPDDWQPVQLRGDGDHLEIEDWLFFGAYSADASRVWVDMPRARDIWRDQIRAAREDLFTPLDVAAQRAIEEGNTARLAEIAAQKNELRDAPAAPSIEAAETLAELRAAWPLDCPPPPMEGPSA